MMPLIARGNGIVEGGVCMSLGPWVDGDSLWPLGPQAAYSPVQ